MVIVRLLLPIAFLSFITVLASCEYRLRAQEQYTITLRAQEKQVFVQELRSGLERVGFSELPTVPMTDNPKFQSLAFQAPPVRVDLFTEDEGFSWALSCSEGSQEFSRSGQEQCVAVVELLARLPGQKSKVDSDA